METETFCWDSSAISVLTKFEVPAGILFPLKPHWIDRSSKESSAYFHITRNRPVGRNGYLLPLGYSGIQL